MRCWRTISTAILIGLGWSSHGEAQGVATRVEQWLAGHYPIGNVSDLLVEDFSRGVAALAEGREVAIRFSEVEFRDGAMVVIDRQIPSRIQFAVDDVSEDASFIQGLWDLARGAGASTHLEVQCVFPAVPAGWALGERFVVSARLTDFREGLAVFRCEGPVAPALPPPRDDWEDRIVPGGVLGEFQHGQYPSIGNVTHPGSDIVAPCGSPVFPASNGRVIRTIASSADPDFAALGYTVVLEHDQPWLEEEPPTYSIYLHLQSAPLVEPGQRVYLALGQPIGAVGDTGTAAGCHLHFEVRHFDGVRSVFHPEWLNIYGQGDLRRSANFLTGWSPPGEWFATRELLALEHLVWFATVGADPGGCVAGQATAMLEGATDFAQTALFEALHTYAAFHGALDAAMSMRRQALIEGRQLSSVETDEYPLLIWVDHIVGVLLQTGSVSVAELRNRPVDPYDGTAVEISEADLSRLLDNIVEGHEDHWRALAMQVAGWHYMESPSDRLCDSFVGTIVADHPTIADIETSQLLVTDEGLPFELQGRRSVVFFGFTQCPDICPTALAELSALLYAIGPRVESFNVFFVTVDPERDTPSAMSEYLSMFHPAIVGITGAPAAVYSLHDSFDIVVERVVIGDGYAINHTASFFITDDRGNVTSVVDWGELNVGVIEELGGRANAKAAQLASSVSKTAR